MNQEQKGNPGEGRRLHQPADGAILLLLRSPTRLRIRQKLRSLNLSRAPG
jgi:hypothetical protein